MSSNVVTLRPLATDNRRRAAEREARVRFVRARRALCWTLEQAAAWLMCSVDAVCLWESGKRRVPAWALVAIEARAGELQVPERRAA